MEGWGGGGHRQEVRDADEGQQTRNGPWNLQEAWAHC